MSDATVAAALRSASQLVVIEAPAGCGKTFQGAQYARDACAEINSGRVLILTHTHAACDVFASRTLGFEKKVDIRTIDSLIANITSVYHKALGLPRDTGTWARNNAPSGYHTLAQKAAALLRAAPFISTALAQRYPIVICDEHQDANVFQHEVIMACHSAGAQLRIFGDPLQRIYGGRAKDEDTADEQRWNQLTTMGDVFEELDEPHRWLDGSVELGRWILEARASLRDGGKIDLRGKLPRGLSVIFAENNSPKQRGGYQVEPTERAPIDAVVNASTSLLVLSSQNDTVDALRAFFNRRLPIWEGHVRESLSKLVIDSQKYKGHPDKLCGATIAFIKNVSTGFSDSAFARILATEVAAGCTAKRRYKPATLQALGQLILDQPDHRGVAALLKRLDELIATDTAFGSIHIDYRREFWDATQLIDFDDPDEAIAEMTRRRTYARPTLPTKAISTIHKAKGLECSDVLVLPCDAQHFADNMTARFCLYVAISRATRSLTLVVSRQNQSPLLLL
jgi:DNA helicase-2/ATP-dependent DNA helicase PcrA